jgi:hypothetical protein
MKQVAIAIIALWVAVQFGGMLMSSSHRAADAAYDRLLDAPLRSIQNPYHNGYFYLFGLTAGSPLDPAKTGYEIWVEESEGVGRAGNQQGNRSELLYAPSPEMTNIVWMADDPIGGFRKKDAPFHATAGQYQILLSRYERWTRMPFDDWGFGRRVTPLGEDILAVHRLYVAEGFSIHTIEGLDRLRKEFQLWRTVLREAKTIRTKVFAQVMIIDDLRLLSQMLSKATVDKDILAMGLQLTLPLSASEYSLAWPIKHQLAVALREGSTGSNNEAHVRQRRAGDEWLARAAHLPPDAFDGIQHPPARSPIALPFGRASQAYAAYYEAIIKASEANVKFLPRMQEVIATVERGMIESVFHPHPVEPNWEVFHAQLIETDTRLRLASLQIQLRRPGLQTSVPTRLAEVGSQYFDPFTGLPMLWSPTQEKIYSVGKDRLDDGGDPTFDISVQASVAHPPAKVRPARAPKARLVAK